MNTTNSFQPNLEQVFNDTPAKTIFYYYDSDAKPVHKTKEVFKNEPKIILYPFNVNRATGQITRKRINEIEFRGWSAVDKLPKDFKTTGGYGFKTKRIKNVLTLVYPRFKKMRKLVVAINGQTRFTETSINLDWGLLEQILKLIAKEISYSDSERRGLIMNQLAGLNNRFARYQNKLTAGQLETFLLKFDSFDKISTKDAESLAKVFDKLPAVKIATTSHFIKTKEKLDIIYLEDIIEHFKKLLQSSNDNEEDWQKYFTKYSWTLTHIFPYQVILRKDKAYVGGKTLENAEGRIVDFLYSTHLTDNLALLEIKTHNKKLLKSLYRKPDVYTVSDELSGGINQCLDQKDSFLRDMNQKNEAYDPKCILVIGTKSALSKSEMKCFELYRANQKNVDIVTFDELLAKLEGLHQVITGKFK